MANYFINTPLNEKRLASINGIGLGNEVMEMNSTKIIQVTMNPKEHKKLIKGFCDLTFDENNACVLPEDQNDILMDLILQTHSIDIMKVAIMKLYNPLAGRDVFGRGTGCR